MKKRKDSFFGIHFDFHAVEGQIVGEDFRPEVVAELLDKTKPDYAQCDTKGHFGYSSYPTKVGKQATKIKKDVLKMWRELTKERDIALYGHHSGLFDMVAAQEHPEWAVVDENGEISKNYLSVFSPYVDEYLIPQLKELALDYELNGAWIDGENWATYVDYNKYATDAYKKETGKEAPRSDEEEYEEYKEFMRRGFENYVAHYVEEVKKIKPDFEITSNWIYCAHMPEKAKVKVDFLSGDYLPFNSVESARHNARGLMARNMPWDLMAWGQNAVPPSFETHNRNTKEYEQYCQEAAMVIALGGGFQFFNIMYGGGGMVQPWAIPMWERVSNFCREREYCHKAKPVHQIGIICPFERVKIKDKLYEGNTEGLLATFSWNNALLDCGYSTEFIYQTEMENINDFPVVVLPYAPHLNEDKKLLEEYVEKGGKLIVDLKSAECFAKVKNHQEKLLFLEGKEALAAVLCDYAEIEGGFEVVGKAYKNNYFSEDFVPCAVKQDNITFMCINFAESYKSNVSTAIKDFLKGVIKATGFVPLVEIEGSSFAELALTQKDGKILINVVNTAGQGGLLNVRGYNEVPKIGPLKVKVHKTDISKITRMPENKEIEFKNKGDYIEFEFDIIHIHTTAILEG